MTLETLHQLFFGKPDTNMLIYTKVTQLIFFAVPFELVFDEYGVSVECKEWHEDTRLLYRGIFTLKVKGNMFF